MRPPAGARRLLLWAAAALPAAGAALFLVLRSGQIPNLDYWWLFPRFFGPAGFAPDPAAWFSRSNEHLLTGSYLLYALNILATRGSNVGLGLLAWLAALAQYFLLCGHLARTGQGPGFWRAAAVAAFCFTPAAAQVWIVGFSGVHWCWANLLAVVSLLALLRYLERGGAFHLAAHLAAGLAATLTFGSALALWPVALVAVARHAPRRVAAGYAAGVIALAAAYRAGMPAAAGALGDLRAVPVYVGSFLGGVFTFSLELACLMALAGLLLAGHFAWRLRSAPADRAPWLWMLLALFALGNALLAAVARDGGGPRGAVSSRYALVAGLFWLSLLQLGFIAYPPRQEGRRRSLRLAWAAAGLAMILAMARTGALYAPQLLQRAALQPLVELTAKLGIEDEELVRAAITVDPAAWRRALPVLRAHRLEPFAPPTLPCGGDGEWDGRPFPLPDRRGGGRLERIDPLGPGVARVSGWLWGGRAGGETCLLLLDRGRRLRGFGLATLPVDDSRTRFLGYVRVPRPDSVFTAVLADPGREPRRLRGSVSLARSAAAGKDPTFAQLHRAGRWYGRGRWTWLRGD